MEKAVVTQHALSAVPPISLGSLAALAIHEGQPAAALFICGLLALSIAANIYHKHYDLRTKSELAMRALEIEHLRDANNHVLSMEQAATQKIEAEAKARCQIIHAEADASIQWATAHRMNNPEIAPNNNTQFNPNPAPWQPLPTAASGH